ncbi:hypothetical protein [Streptomyces sp. NPDC050548]|uniref:hypothetical protein n=1 Tax=Streptomyces sp. NPDC050548 TaxID=3365629 RepID=UPI0037B0671A
MLVAEIRNGRGQVLAKMLAHERFNPVLMGIDVKKFPLLGSIDPYGDTAFNYLQVERILIEIQEHERTGGAFDAFLGELETFSSQALAKPHRFLWFIGD